MSRFFVDPAQIGDQQIHINDPGDLHHMQRVLRLKAGDEVDISDGSIWEYRARIDALEQTQARLIILDKQKCAAEPNIRITLYQGIPKQGKMESIVQKTVELGIHRIVPVFMDRTVVVDKGNFHKKIERWQRIAAEAVKQCRRGIIPEVSEAMRMPDVLAELASYDLVLMPYENEAGVTLKDVLRKQPPTGADSPARLAVLIGPEGGFSDSEVAAVCAAGGRSVTLGRTILRTETAGPAAVAMIMYELEL